MSEVNTTYRGVEVSYNEHSNEWMCNLFTIPAESLSAAKVRIDKKLDTDKKTPFKRFKAFVKRFRYNQDGSWPLVEVTSITDDGKEARCMAGKKREKIGGRYSSGELEIYPETPENSALVEKIHDHEAEIADLNSKIERAEKKLTIWEPESQLPPA